MTEEEIFVVFDIVDKGGDPQEAQEEIHKKLHLRPPHRKTVTAVFNVGIELSKRRPSAPDALTNQEVDEIVEKAAYGMSHPRAVELHRLYLLWKIDRHQETEKRNIDAVLSALKERQLKVWFLLRFKHWDEEKIAEKLGAPLRDIQYEIKEIKIREQLERHKTKEESKMEQSQSMVNLPPWVNQAQWEHLEGKEQRDELGVGLSTITYPRGASIRQEVEFFKNSFSDINPRNQSFWVPKDEIVMAQLHGHLPDKAFWELIEGSEGFIKKAKKCEALLDAAREKFTSAGEELAPLQQVVTGPVPDVYITSGWARRVLVRALSRELGFSERSKYHISEIKEGDFILEDEEVLYRGPDAVAAEQKHRELVKGFIKSEEFPPIVNLMKDLRNLVQRIFARIDKCLRGREYSYNYCPDCPADQARKMLASKEE